MEIVDIFVIVKDSLYSILYSEEAQNEFDRLFDLWNDAEYLESFFTEHIDDLNSGFWGEISVEEAMIRTRSEANRLEDKIVEIAEMGKNDQYSTLSSLFQPLHDSTTAIESLEPNKVKGDLKKSWLRIYAIRIESNLFLITGGAIKLTRTMNERDYLLCELNKLDLVREYLNNEDNYDDHPIFELFI